MPDSFSSERRKYYRIKKNFMLAYFDLNDPLNRHDASQLKNISQGGICLVTSKAFSPQTQLGIELKTPVQTDAVYLQGVVLESKEKIKNIIYETRLQFELLTPQAQTLLQKLIEQVQNEEKKQL